MQLTAICRSLSCKNGLTRKVLRVMKLTAILLTIACLQVTARSDGQTVTLKVKNAPLKEVFREIQKQTRMDILVNENALANTHKVTLEVRDMPVAQVLSLCLKDEKLSYNIVDGTIVISSKQTAVIQPTIIPPVITEPPPIDVTGRVTDSTGAPLQGASVRVRGTKQGTTTDANGNFTLNAVDENATLEISYQGYQTISLKVPSSGVMGSIQMKLAPIEIGGVIINTGYQQLKPNEVNGSYVVIDNKTLNEQVGTNIIDRLNGLTNGFYNNIGKASGPGVIIRGLSTINGPLDPLIILDNFPYVGDINNINPNDVESVTILKDAAATSIYGAKGGNGVIVITTKQGKFNQRLKIDINSNVTFTPSPDFYSQKQMTIDDYVYVEEYLFSKGYFDASILNTSSRPALTPAVEILLKRRNGIISTDSAQNMLDLLKLNDSRDQYDKYFYRDAITQQNSINLRGGSGNIAWLVGGSYNTTVSNLGRKGDKINVRVNNQYKPFKNLQLSLGVYYTISRNHGSEAPSYNSIKVGGRSVPYLKFADDQGNPLPVAQLREGYIDTAGSGRLLDWRFFPLKDYKYSESESKTDGLVANFGLRYEPVKNLIFEFYYSRSRQSISNESYNGIESDNRKKKSRSKGIK